MDIRSIAKPEIYMDSADFRFFTEWFADSLARINYDIEHGMDLLDPLRVKDELLWALADTMGYKLDDRLPISFNRLVLLYFMSMIRNRGSKDGVTLAAETNLAQFNILKQAKDKEILYSRLEDPSIPVNSVYVTAHTDKGYIDVVYFADKKPLDACIEYVRPLGMYLFQHAGVRFDAKTKVSVDARLTDERDVGLSFGPTHVGHYSREDYARMQKTANNKNVTSHTRRDVWQSNMKADNADPDINPGYRALQSLQLCNNEEITLSLIEPFFSLGYGPQDVGVTYPDNYLKPPYVDRPNPGVEQPATKAYNLRYDRATEEAITPDVYTVDDDRTESILKPRPAVNPIMAEVGDAISLNAQNTKYLMKNKNTGKVEEKDSTDL